MRDTDRLTVQMEGKKVGELAKTRDLLCAFQYDRDWLQNGFSISPLSLPLEDRVFIPKGYDPFEGLFGVFSDSLPDGWGRLLVDRMLRKQGIDPNSVDPVLRLAIVGNSGMGALTYVPEYKISNGVDETDLDALAESCSQIFDSKNEDGLDELFSMGGSSGGARPKVNYKIDGEEWIVKFPASFDRRDIGLQEYEYSLCARECGIDMPETRLMESSLCPGYFAVKRFDRDKGRRIHMISASGLLETSHRLPNLDYDILMRLCMKLTNSFSETEKLYRLMCFNVFAHNRDDHSKNFSFLYDTSEKKWILSPAYDLTYSNSIGGEHATTVSGNGSDPGIRELLCVADDIGLDHKRSEKTALQIEEIVHERLRGWLDKNK